MSTLTSRHEHIINKLKEKGTVYVADLCKELDVSPVTIRKDLKFLEDKILLFRTHGGATLNNPYMPDRHVSEKIMMQAAEKQKISEFAAGLIVPNDCILIASGTTVLYLAKNLVATGHLTVITAALNVALELIHHTNVDVIQLGGHVRRTSASVTGTYAGNMLDDFSCSKLFLGVDGVDTEYGITTTNIMEAQLNRKMIESCQKTIVLADSSKFGKRGFGKICGMEDVDMIITDNKISEHTADSLRAMGVEVINVEV